MFGELFNLEAEAYAFTNDVLRDINAVGQTRCFLLKRDGQTKQFIHVYEFTTGHRLAFDGNRAEGGLFEYATIDIDGFRDLWALGSHIGYGVPAYNTLLNADAVEVYLIVPDEKDQIDPDGSSVYFAGRLVREGQERYAMPVKATGDYTFLANPADGDNFPTLNGYAPLVFKTASAAWYELEIKATLALTLANIIAVFTAQDVFTEVDFTSDATKLILTYATGGIVGNAFTLGTGTANITPSGATLTGGTG